MTENKVVFDPNVYWCMQHRLADGEDMGADIGHHLKWAMDCRPTMTGIIERYGIKGKDVVSIGCGSGFEEFWFHRHENRMTLVDNNEGLIPGYTASTLEQVADITQAATDDSHVEARGRNSLSDVFECRDAVGFVNDPAYESAFDVCYISSLAPAEHYREDIVAARETPWPWPLEENPFWPAEFGAATTLRPGGLWIMQSYRGGGGPPLDGKPTFLEAARRQLASYGLQLIECFCFRTASGVKLLVALKGTEEEAQLFAESLETASAVKTFHGRYPNIGMRNDILRIDVVKGPLEVPVLNEVLRSGTIVDHGTDLPGVEEAVSSLIERYGLAGQSVAIFGHVPDFGSACFRRHGCDASRDFNAGADGGSNITHAAVFVSNLRASETYKDSVVSAHTASPAYEPYKTWPEDVPPFPAELLQLADSLEDGGLFFVQVSTTGQDIVQNPHLVSLIKTQFKAAGLHLVEYHYFKRSPCVVLWTAIKGEDQAIKEKLAAANPLAAIHGRYDEEDVRRDLARVGVLP